MRASCQPISHSSNCGGDGGIALSIKKRQRAAAEVMRRYSVKMSERLKQSRWYFLVSDGGWRLIVSSIIAEI